MANKEHLEILLQGTEAWNKWRRKKLNIYPDLSGAQLNHADLRGANFVVTDLRCAEFNSADLEGAYFGGADLNVADFNDANLIATYFGGANLSYASFISADLSYANLKEANLTKADFISADLTETNLSDTLLEEASFYEAKFGGTIIANTDLRTVKGLETVKHSAPSTIATSTFERSQGQIPKIFLQKIGMSDILIESAQTLMKKTSTYYTCFISYSSKDEEFAQWLYSDLQSRGVRCWFAPEDMDVGDKIKHRIDTSIRLYDKLLLILSEHSIASTWVAYEVERALNKEPAGTPNVLYPVRLDDAIMTCKEEWAQDIKETRHIGNFEGWKTNHDAYQDSFKRLLRALKSKSANA